MFAYWYKNMCFNGYTDVEKMSRIMYNIRDILQVVLWIVDI